MRYPELGVITEAARRKCKSPAYNMSYISTPRGKTGQRIQPVMAQFYTPSQDRMASPQNTELGAALRTNVAIHVTKLLITENDVMG